ncbi:MAG: hypothetical protein JW768_09805 [Chitinispirillaceae bacterium]|nr:hypothetical protein [Chitinispirillaceae bacterium]
MTRCACGRTVFTIVLWSGIMVSSLAESGYNLWLRYSSIADTAIGNQYRTSATQIVVQGTDSTHVALREELKRGFDSLLVQNTPFSSSVTQNGAVVAGTPASSSIINSLGLTLNANTDAYRIITMQVSGRNAIVIASRGSVGVLYGTFHLLRFMQTNKQITSLDISEIPKIKRRILNHWANLDGSMERGYSGNNIFRWSQLPGTVDPRYTVYARACASVGINGAVLNNVNNSGNTQILSTTYIGKIRALAGALRPYGVRVYLSAYFDAPISIGGLSTADPLNSQVINWWASKVREIYNAVPDFGGFLVKANSEGQAGPKNWGRTHAQGANCIADALAPHGGVCIWRAFIYDDAIDADRMKRAYIEFKALDGQFRNNVILQAKNGPYDFQPREPVHPIFGGIANTNVGMEFQITLEYLGQGIQLVYMGPYWKEVLDFDTHANGSGSTIGKAIDGTLYGDTVTCISGVANVGNNMNWCGHHFHQANWFAYGRLAWNHTLSSDSIADEWARMTWGNAPTVVTTVTSMMAGSREACVNYMTPLGLCGLFCMGTRYGSDHYGPCPGQNDHPEHPDWNAVYWHRVDAAGVGYNRTSTGSNFVGQYFPTVRDRYNSIATTPPEYLAAFHHVSWNYTIPSTGRTFWDELCYRYCIGCQYVYGLRRQWSSLSGLVDASRFNEVSAKLATHETDANIWRTTCLNYFSTFSRKPITSCNTGIRESVGHRQTGVAAIPGKDVTIYSVQGRLVASLSLHHSIPLCTLEMSVQKRLGPGMYIVKAGQSKPIRMVVGGCNSFESR